MVFCFAMKVHRANTLTNGAASFFFSTSFFFILAPVPVRMVGSGDQTGKVIG